MEQFCSAADSYRAGRLVECKDRLLEVQLQGFSRVQWYLDCNLLTCRFQELLQKGGGRNEVQGILLGYERLWKKMTGVAPGPFSLSVELTVVLSLCQLHTILHNWSMLRPLIFTAINRISQVNHSSYSSRSLDTVDVESFGDVSVTCVEKLKVISALQEAVERGEKESISKAIYAHSHWLNGNQAEYAYKQAWVQYSNEDYHSSLGTLSSPPLSPPPLTLSPFVHLLCGACHSKLDHPNLALLHWRRSMETGHTPNHTPFLASLHNSAIAYTAMGNTVAAVATRRLEIEALRCQSDCDTVSLHYGCGFIMRRVGQCDTSLTCCGHVCMHGSSLAVEDMMRQVRRCETAWPWWKMVLLWGLHFLFHLPFISYEPCVRWPERGGGEEGKEHVSRATEVLVSWQRYLEISSHVCVSDGISPSGREQCLGEVEKMLCEVKDKQIHQQLHQLKVLQQHSQMLLAIVAIANSHWREALQLLACVLATPTGLFNHCLLQCRVGVVMGGAGGWLERRGSTPVGRSDARDKLRHSQQLLHTVTGFERDYMAMDIAMLKIWLQHNR